MLAFCRVVRRIILEIRIGREHRCASICRSKSKIKKKYVFLSLLHEKGQILELFCSRNRKTAFIYLRKTEMATYLKSENMRDIK